MSQFYPLKIRNTNTSSYKITLYGDNFNFIEGNGLYLSGSNYNEQLVDLYSNIKNLSANNPPFSGILVDNFTVNSNNILEFNLPENLPTGKYDIIYCNPAGYFKASINNKFKYIIVGDIPNGDEFAITSINNIILETIDNDEIVLI